MWIISQDHDLSLAPHEINTSTNSIIPETHMDQMNPLPNAHMDDMHMDVTMAPKVVIHDDHEVEIA